MAIFRGEIYFVELGPTRGREIDRKRRPVVVLSADDVNSKPLVVVVIPGGTKSPGKPLYRYEVLVSPNATNGLKTPTAFQCFQIKALDHSRFDSGPIGELSDVELKELEHALKDCLLFT